MIEVLDAHIHGQHLSELDKLSKAEAIHAAKYSEMIERRRKNLGSPLTPEEGDHPLAQLLDFLETAASDMYGHSGEMDNLIRRVTYLRADKILTLCDELIPEDYHINRRFIRALLKLCQGGGYPEWRGRRFLGKLKQHAFHPYSDEVFTQEAQKRNSQAEHAAKAIFEKFPDIIAVGITGSLARNNFFGFHPQESDIDLNVYTPAYDSALMDKIGAFAEEIAGKEKIAIGPEGHSESVMGARIHVWELSNRESIRKHNQRVNGPDDMTFGEMSILAANHKRGKIIAKRNHAWVDFETAISLPLTKFYNEKVMSLSRRIQATFALLDGKKNLQPIEA